MRRFRGKNLSDPADGRGYRGRVLPETLFYKMDLRGFMLEIQVKSSCGGEIQLQSPGNDRIHNTMN